MNESPSLEQVLELQSEAIQQQYLHWTKYEIPTFQFVLLIIMLITPWIVWWKLVDRKRIPEIFIYGMLVLALVTFLDETGCQLNLWEYRIDIEPLFPRLISMNYAMFPVGYMLIYQYFTKWKSFIAANIAAATFFTFIGEPVFVALNIYVLISWRNIYSFPIYIIIAVALKALVQLIMKAYRKAS